MMALLSIAMVVALVSAAFVVLRWPTYQCFGDTPLPTLSFLAILFTSGLDVGLILRRRRRHGGSTARERPPAGFQDRLGPWMPRPRPAGPCRATLEILPELDHIQISPHRLLTYRSYRGALMPPGG